MIRDSGPAFDWPNSHYTRETASSALWPVNWSIAAHALVLFVLRDQHIGLGLSFPQTHQISQHCQSGMNCTAKRLHNPTPVSLCFIFSTWGLAHSQQ